MNQEIKLKLQQAAETAWEQDQQTNPSPVNPHAYVYGYKAGAQTILDNPGGWGLAYLKDLKPRLAKYRSTLLEVHEMLRLADPHCRDRAMCEIRDVIEEALKQEEE